MGLGVIGGAKDWAAFGGGRNMRKRGRTGVDTAALDVYKREVGELSTRRFAHRLAASEVLFSNFNPELLSPISSISMSINSLPSSG